MICETCGGWYLDPAGSRPLSERGCANIGMDFARQCKGHGAKPTRYRRGGKRDAIPPDERCKTCDGTGHGIGGVYCFNCTGTGRRAAVPTKKEEPSHG